MTSDQSAPSDSESRASCCVSSPTSGWSCDLCQSHSCSAHQGQHPWIDRIRKGTLLLVYNSTKHIQSVFQQIKNLKSVSFATLTMNQYWWILGVTEIILNHALLGVYPILLVYARLTCNFLVGFVTTVLLILHDSAPYAGRISYPSVSPHGKCRAPTFSWIPHAACRALRHPHPAPGSAENWSCQSWAGTQRLDKQL